MDDQSLVIQKRQYNTIILTGIAIAILFYPVVATLILTKSMMPIFRLLMSRLLLWITLPLVYLYATKVEGRDFLLWKEKPQGFFFYVLAIIILFILAFFAQTIASIPRMLHYQDNYTALKYWNGILRGHKELLVFTCITAGVTEELLIRAYILPRLALLFKSAWLPVLISSLIFSLLHLSYGNLSECIFTFLFGVICAIFYQKYQNIQVLIIFHFLYDIAVLLR